MIELLAGSGLAISAGLNAYIPLLTIGLLGRFTDLVTLPASWSWLENPWVLVTLGALLVVEVVADKFPVIDSINDWIQTVIRPTAGGLAFGSGSTASTVAISDPSTFFSSHQWVPIVLGVVLALIVHVTKSTARPAINLAFAGVATPVVSAAEDAGSVSFSLAALLIPLLLILIVPLVVWFAIRLIAHRLKRNSRTPKGPAVSTPI